MKCRIWAYKSLRSTRDHGWLSKAISLARNGDVGSLESRCMGCVLSELMSQRLLAAAQLFCVLQHWNAASAEAIVQLRPAGDYRRWACRSYLFIQVHASIPTASHLVLCRSALLFSPEELVASRCTEQPSELERKGTRWLPLHFSVNVHHCNSRLIVFFKNRCEKVESKQIWTSASIYKINVPFIYLVGWMKVKSDGAWWKQKLSNIRAGGGMKANRTTERGVKYKIE